MELLDIHTEGKKYKQQVYDLYESAFPKEEKKPLEMMETLSEQGKMELLAITDNGEFIGLAMNMLSEKTALLDYFAIVSHKRDCGYGGKAVRLLQERFAGKKYIFEVEMQDPSAENAKERQRRKAFYLRNGLKETGLFVHVYGTDFEILTPDGKLTYQEYVGMLKYILGEDVFTIHPELIKEILTH